MYTFTGGGEIISGTFNRSGINKDYLQSILSLITFSKLKAISRTHVIITFDGISPEKVSIVYISTMPVRSVHFPSIRILALPIFTPVTKYEQERVIQSSVPVALFKVIIIFTGSGFVHAFASAKHMLPLLAPNSSEIE